VRLRSLSRTLAIMQAALMTMMTLMTTALAVRMTTTALSQPRSQTEGSHHERK
jgi:hypothetical protein